MKNSLICFWSLFLILKGAYGQNIQEFKTTPTSVIGYIEYIPPDYHTNSFEYPVVIFLHGLGQRGPVSDDPKVLETGYNNLVVYGPPKHVKNGTQFPFLLISPALKSNYGDWPAWYVMEVIEHVRTYLRIDPKRIYLTGCSLGGGGTWTTAQDYPDYFGAVAPVAGSRNSLSKACAIAASDLPVWAFHGNRDNVVPLSRSVNMVNAINACNPDVKARMTIYDGVGHNSFVQAYDLTQTYQSPNLYDWMLSWESDLGNKIPVANAGPDETINVADQITLSGKGSDPDGSISNYSWAKLKGGAVTFSGRTSASVTLSALEVGTYVFRLTVRDNRGAITSDDVTVTVSSGGNLSPVVSAGPDKLITLPVNSVTLQGTGSDPDGSVTSYTWTKVAGGSASLADANTSNLKVSGLEAGIYTFRLTVKDNSGTSKSDDVKVTVNMPPSVNAGADQVITLPLNEVTISATASDADGTIASYAWKKVSGPAVSLSGTAGQILSAKNMQTGTYLFRVTVKDNRGAEMSDEVRVTVLEAAAENDVPVANAGPDKILSLPETSVTLNGSASDSDGSIASYRWSKISGGGVSLSGSSSSKLVVSDLSAGIYIFRLTVTDDKGARDSDDVTIIVNVPPVVNAGPDKLISLPSSSVTLTATASDSDGRVVSYKWEKISGGNAKLNMAGTSVLQLTGLEAGDYRFRLSVTDDHGAGRSDDVSVRVNIPPVSNAGPDVQTAITSSITLTGKGTDRDGTITSYKWRKITGGSASLANTNATSLKITDLQAGQYVFELTVTDNDGASHADRVSVIIQSNMAPVANAGPDKLISLPSSSVTLTATASDSDGKIVSYKWEKISGGNAKLNTAETPVLQLTGLEAGDYRFRLSVTDDRGASHSDDVSVRVNIPPVSNAGPDVETAITSSITLTGKGTDRDGTITSYKWRKITGGSASLGNTNATSLKITDLQAGQYVFELTVMDNDGASHADRVSVIVQNNVAPVANAGPDRVITLPANKITLTGTGTDTDGTIVSYSWKKIAGGSAVLAGMDSPTLSITGLPAGSYEFALTVKDNAGGSHTDHVNVKVNVAPSVDAGPDKLITLPENKIILTGSVSDADGSVASVVWQKVAGGTAKLSNNRTASVTVSDLSAGIYDFRLTVKDNDGATQSDLVRVIVNRPPVVSAGSDITITLPVSTVSIVGSGYDPDGVMTSWLWNKVSGPPIEWKGRYSPTLEVFGLKEGVYVFRLRGVDNHASAATDDVTVVVKPELPNVPPVAYAGDDLHLNEPASGVQLNGSGVDQDGEIAAYAWKLISGKNVIVGDTTDASLQVNGVDPGIYVFRLTVTDNKGASGSDDVMVTVFPQDAVDINEPLADAGPDLTVTLPVDEIHITGLGSTRSGRIISYQWDQTGGGPALLDNTHSATLSIRGITTPGERTFRLRVKNSLGYTGLARVKIRYVVPGQNDLPDDDTFDSDGLVTCANCEYLIWNASLQKLYDGPLIEEAFEITLSKEGLYYYNIRRAGKIIKRGKIFKRLN